MNHTKQIAIVGAGVAGMALAILATRRGHHVTLFERGREVSSMGAGVTLWPNAVFVLERMGLCDDIQRLGGTPRYMKQFDRRGSTMGEFDIAAVNRLCGFPSVTILRRDLIGTLATTLHELAVDIRFGCSITTQDIDDLKQRYDLVVGADGRMNSVVRQAIYTETVSPRYQGFINIIGISPLTDGVIDNAIHDVRGPGTRFGIVPVSTDRCFWAGAWRASIDKERGLSTWYDDMDQRFRDWPDPVRRVLTTRDDSSLNRIFVHDLDPLPYWHQGNVLIIGDAAHAPLPTSGQGACQALEDAWHLVQMLEEHDQLSSALTGFYQRRIAKTSAAQAVGRQVAQQIFGEHGQPRPSDSGISAEQLSQFWMEGLDSYS